MIENHHRQLSLIRGFVIIIYISMVLSFQNQSGLAQTNNLSSTSAGTGIPEAKSLFDTQTMNVPSSVKSVIVMIVDEAHEPPESNHKHISDHNSYLLPTNLILPMGTNLSFIDADAPWDTPHPHTLIIMDYNSNKIVYTTGKLDYSNSSKTVNLTEGKYTVTDTKYPWIKGNITVTPNQKVASNADLIIGGFYTTSNKVLNNKDNDGGVHPGWLGYYRTQFPMNGFQIISEYNFHYAKCKYCPGGFWPDIKSADHVLIVYSTPQGLTQALSKLAKMIWNNVYI